VLKGGVLLAAYDLRRPTKDIDLLARDLDSNTDVVLALVVDIINEFRDDGCVYGQPSAEVIREEDEYNGVRVSIPCSLAHARVSFHVDVNIGDPVSPAPRRVDVERLLGGHITVHGYPLTMVYAEKLVTAMQRGAANTRWRDFADIYLLSSRHHVAADALKHSMSHVAKHRRVALTPLAEVLDGFADLGQSKWSAWVRKQRLGDRLPSTLAEVLERVLAFADPVIGGAEKNGNWDPSKGAWTSS
jgi:hypothetical protein